MQRDRLARQTRGECDYAVGKRIGVGLVDRIAQAGQERKRVRVLIGIDDDRRRCLSAGQTSQNRRQRQRCEHTATHAIALPRQTATDR